MIQIIASNYQIIPEKIKCENRLQKSPEIEENNDRTYSSLFGATRASSLSFKIRE